MDGILNINKPEGETSFGVVAMIKRLSGERRVGHAGTLDPLATGVLVVCLGKGTRIIEFLVDSTKTYLAGIELGTTTDTYDGSGQVIHRANPDCVDRKRLEEVLDSFRGPIHQIPPMYSAVKHRGQPLYKLARAGIEVKRKSRQVTIQRLEITDWRTPVLTMEIECSKGTYIRALAHDLGVALGCGAYLKNLVRTRCGCFDINDSISMPELEEGFRQDYWPQFVHPIDTALSHLQSIVVSEANEELIKQGRPVAPEEGHNPDDNSNSAGYCRAYSLDGRFLGILEHVSGKHTWQPKKVFSR